MADRYPAAKPDVRLSRDDHAWLAKVAGREHTNVQAVVNHALWFFRYWHGKGQKVLNEALNLLDRVDEEYQKADPAPALFRTRVPAAVPARA